MNPAASGSAVIPHRIITGGHPRATSALSPITRRRSGGSGGPAGERWEQPGQLHVRHRGHHPDTQHSRQLQGQHGAMAFPAVRLCRRSSRGAARASYHNRSCRDTGTLTGRLSNTPTSGASWTFSSSSGIQGRRQRLGRAPPAPEGSQTAILQGADASGGRPSPWLPAATAYLSSIRHARNTKVGAQPVQVPSMARR